MGFFPKKKIFGPKTKNIAANFCNRGIQTVRPRTFPTSDQETQVHTEEKRNRRICRGDLLVVSHSEKLANSIRASCFVRSVFYSRDILKNSPSLFACLSLSSAFTIRGTFLEVRDLYSRVFLCAQRFLFASHSEKFAFCIRAPFFECCVCVFLGVSNGTYQL